MPQLSPLKWLTIFWMIILITYLMNMKMNFLTKKLMTFNFKSQSKIFYKWKI